MSSFVSRRRFLQSAAAASTLYSIFPSSVFGASEKVNLACVGIGYQGGIIAKALHATGLANIVALCDVDWKYAQRTFDAYPKAKKYWDWRKMYDEMDKDIDAVVVATADHAHAAIAAYAMTLGKHVYVQKPLTHSVYESRLLTKLAAEYGVATQMGNQGASGELL